MHLNHPELVQGLQVTPWFPCKDVVREGSVQSNHSALRFGVPLAAQWFNEVRCLQN